MTDDTTEMMTDDTADESGLYLEKLAEALLRLGIIEMEGVVVDGSEVAGAIMALDAQLTAGWQLAESVRWAKEAEARLEATDPTADPAAWETASRDKQSAEEAMVAALRGWDEAAGLDENESEIPVSAS
jgi:hypothetical protein